MGNRVLIELAVYSIMILIGSVLWGFIFKAATDMEAISYLLVAAVLIGSGFYGYFRTVFRGLEES